MIAAIFTLIIYLIVAGMIYWLILTVIDTIPIPDPPARLVKLLVLVLLVLVIVVLLLNLIGANTGIGLPKL